MDRKKEKEKKNYVLFCRKKQVVEDTKDMELEPYNKINETYAHFLLLFFA